MPGGDSQVLLGVASEGVGTEAVINPVSSQKALIIQDDVAKCHRTRFLSPAKTEPLKDMINGPDFHPFSQNLKSESMILLLWQCRFCQHHFER